MPVMDKQFFIALESTPGTEETPTATEVVDATRGSVVFTPQGEPIQRELIRPHMDTEPPVAPPAMNWSVAMELEVKASTGADTPPELAAFLQASGFSETVNVATDVTYDLEDFPNATPASATLVKEEAPVGDGNDYRAIGCRIGAVEFRGGVTERLMVSGTALGQYKRPADLAALSSATYFAGTPLAVLSGTGNPFQIHSYDMIVRSWTCRVGLEAVLRGSMKDRASFGYIYPCWLNRTSAVSGEFEIELVDQTAFDLWSRYEAATAATGSVVYEAGARTLTFTLRNVVFGAPTEVPGPPKTIRVPWTAHRSGANGALSLVFA